MQQGLNQPSANAAEILQVQCVNYSADCLLATNLHKKGGREGMVCWVGDRQRQQQKSALADSLVFLPVRAYHNLLEISGEHTGSGVMQSSSI